MTYSGQEGFGKGRFSVAVSLVRWLVVLIALVGVASIGACGSRGNDSDGDDAPQQPAAAATVAATETPVPLAESPTPSPPPTPSPTMTATPAPTPGPPTLAPGERVEVTSMPNDFYGRPKFTPRGDRVMYHDGSVKIISLQGGFVRLLSSSNRGDFNPHVSPDGTQIVFYSRRNGPDDIYLMDANGRNRVQLRSDGGFEFGPEFSPDGQANRLHLAASRDSRCGHLPDGHRRIRCSAARR